MLGQDSSIRLHNNPKAISENMATSLNQNSYLILKEQPPVYFSNMALMKSTNGDTARVMQNVRGSGII
jgi:hypothetical protein